jgi:hypothetical protein
MKRHNMFEEVPRGFRFYSNDITRGDGYWVPAPIYWILRIRRELYIVYLRWQLRRKRK